MAKLVRFDGVPNSVIRGINNNSITLISSATNQIYRLIEFAREAPGKRKVFPMEKLVRFDGVPNSVIRGINNLITPISSATNQTYRLMEFAREAQRSEEEEQDGHHHCNTKIEVCQQEAKQRNTKIEAKDNSNKSNSKEFLILFKMSMEEPLKKLGSCLILDLDGILLNTGAWRQQKLL